jgi:hypothetical protein
VREPFDLLGGHVRGRPEGGARGGDARGVAGDDLRDAEVEDLGDDRSVGRVQEHVGRLEVSVNDALAVRGRDRVDDGDHDRQQRVERQLRAL